MDKYQSFTLKKPKLAAKRRCHRCHGVGLARCVSCGGQGRMAKSKDHFGKPLFNRCDACYGTRTRRCSTCSGEGFI